MKHLTPGMTGWLAVGVVVVAAELLDEKTMSAAFHDASRHPVAGPVVLVAWAILTAHLFGAIPEPYDPIHMFWKHTILKERLEYGARSVLD